MDAARPLFVITGQLSAGKSTVARALLDRYERGYHVDVDAIREMVTPGLASPLEWTDETTRQFDLAVEASVALAAVYHRAGFAVAIEGGIDPAAVDGRLADAGLADNAVRVILHPRLDVALDRNRERRTKPFDTSILEGVMRTIEDDLRRDGHRAGWTVVDSSDESIDQTVDRILSIAR